MALNKEEFIQTTVDRLENGLSNAIEGSSFEAPQLLNEIWAEAYKWYRVPLKTGKSGDGSEYHIYIKKGAHVATGPLCIFFSGGGVAWDEWTASRPVTSGKIMSGQANYYWNNLRPVTQIMNIGMGITDTNHLLNPFYDWNFVVIAYSTGDFHIGDSEYIYHDENGIKKTLYFHGYKNYSSAMEYARSIFEAPKKLLIAGDSAGGFATAALSLDILTKYYPFCDDVTVFSDSSLLERYDWKHILKDKWHSPKPLWKHINGANITVEWYKHLYEAKGNSIRYLYAGSKKDFLLSAFRSEVENGIYETNQSIQEEYAEATVQMIDSLKKINKDFGIFEYDWKNKIRSGGGTIHTAVRTPYFYTPCKKHTLATWLCDAVNGRVYSV